jgi:tetratricopeptide (TPR) repeat protein/CHAT domain-containing protein
MNQKNKTFFVKLIACIFRSLLFGIWLVLLVSPLIAQKDNQIDNRVLLPGIAVEHTLAGNQIHSYKIKLRENEYFNVRVEQRGIDVELILLDTNGETIIKRDRPNGEQRAETLSFIAPKSGYYQLDVKAVEEKAKAGKYEIKRETPRSPTTKDRQRIEAETLFQEGLSLSQADDIESVKQACEKYESALALWQEIGDKYAEALTQTNLGYCSELLEEDEKALAAHEKALLFYLELKYKYEEGMTRTALAVLNAYEAKPEIAVTQYKKAKTIFRQLKKTDDESLLNKRFSGVTQFYVQTALTLVQNQDQDSYQKALNVAETALTMYQALEDKGHSADVLLILGRIKDILNEKQKALFYYNQALLLFRAVGNKVGEATTLNNIGSIYDFLGEKQNALTYYNQSLSLIRLTEDRLGEAITLNNIGGVYSSLGETQKALDYYNQALPLIKAAEDKSNEATTLNNIGSLYNSLGEKQKALDYYQQALSITREIGDKSSEALTLNNIGGIYDLLGDKQKALDYYQQALPITQAVGDKKSEAGILNNIGSIYDDWGEKQKALDYYTRALPLHREAGNKLNEARTLNNIGLLYNSMGEKQKALEYYNEALPLMREFGGKSDESTTLNNIGLVYDDLGDKKKALDYYAQALPLAQAAGDKQGIAITLVNIGFIYNAQGEKQKALDYYNQALSLSVETGDKFSEAKILNNLGAFYNDLGDKPTAVNFYDRALSLRRALGDKSGEASTLNNFGILYNELGDNKKALDYFRQALSLMRATGDREGEAKTLSNIGSIYDALGERQKALEFYEKVLSIQQNVGDKSGQATTLNNIGFLYQSLGEKRTALNYYYEALQLYKELGEVSGEATILNNIGAVHSSYDNLEEKKTALDFYVQALSLRKAIGEKQGIAASLNNIGFIYKAQDEKQKALDYYHQALSLSVEIGDKQGEARTLNNIGGVYDVSGDKQKALDYYNRALPLIKASGDRAGEAAILNNLMLTWRSLKNPRAAVFYGKQSVNVYQQFRLSAQNLKDGETQKTFLKSVAYTYRFLAAFLIEYGRLAEAQQVLNTFKDQQYFDFNPQSAKKPQRLVMTPRETKLSSQYDMTSGEVDRVRSRLEELKRTIGARTPNEKESEQIRLLELELKTAADEFLDVLKQIETEFSEPQSNSVEDKSPEIEETSQMQEALGKLKDFTKNRAVAIYISVSENRCSALIVAHENMIPVVIEVKGNEINQKAKDFLMHLSAVDEQTKMPRFSEADIKKNGKVLYDIIFAPIIEKLKKFNIKPDVLMWSLDEGLNYVPVAALYDGKQYLAQQYRNVIFTRADMKRVLSSVDSQWTGSGFYNSKPYVVTVNGKKAPFAGLKNAKTEVETIFGVPPSPSVVKGKFISNELFTKDSFFQALEQHLPLVHIASHFILEPGDENASFLLMGDGEKLTLAEIKEKPDDLFEGVQLLTLSACQTAFQKERESDGHEIDSFAELAQRKGAKAVMASLWSVDDESTSRLMTQFYKTRQTENFTKAEALQEAQLNLLRSKDFSHPYYWAPFILIGNWR